MNFQCRALRLDLQHLVQLKLPCILHWDMNHFVVLESMNHRSVTIHDPAVGTRKITLDDLANHFTGVALELMPSGSFIPVTLKSTYPIIAVMGRVSGLKSGLLQILSLGIALHVCALIAPFYLQWVVDEALLSGDHDLVTVLGMGFLLLVLLQTAISAVRAWITNSISIDLNFQWLSNAFAHLLKLPFQYFERRHTGDVVSRFSSIQTIQHCITTQFVEGAIDGLLMVTTFVMMLLYSVPLAVIGLSAVILYGLLRWIFYRRLRQATAEKIIHEARQQTYFLESVRGIRSLRIFDRAGDRHTRWLNLLTEQFNAELRIARLDVVNRTANFAIINVERIVIIWIAALAVLRAELSVGMLFAFMSYKDQFSQRTASLIDKIFELRMLRLYSDRVADIVFTKAEENAKRLFVETKTVAPSLELVNVSFRYSDTEPWVIRDLHLHIPAGQCIAVTGASGCGKTTLIKILLGLVVANEGEVRVGGRNLSHFGLSNYRAMVGAVMQDDCLFAGSIADNISFFDQLPDLEWVQQCAALAAVHTEISAMPMGYNTLVGDIGSGLSGGQHQRILLARALYRKPRILIMDEATSHLDIWNEQAVNTAIEQLQLTRILVAHRPETIAMADRVVLLHQGRIVEEYMQKVPRAGATEDGSAIEKTEPVN